MQSKHKEQALNDIQVLNSTRVEKPNVKEINKVLYEKVIKPLKSLDHHSFGSDLPHDYDICRKSLIIHRGTTKFARPGKKDLLRSQAFTTYMEYEEYLSALVENERTEDFKLGWIGHPIRNFFHSLMSDFDIKSLLRNAPLRFSTGETYISCKGDTIVVAKLCKKEHWCTTSNNLENTVYLIYHCRGLKLAATNFFPLLTKREKFALFARFAHKNSEVGYYVFRHLLINHVLTVVDGARASSVPKNEETDRFINVECFFNVLVQACIETYFRRKLKRIGNDLDLKSVVDNKTLSRSFRDTQHLHGFLIRFEELCTIDLKNASDSTLLKRVLSLFPRPVCSAILTTRSPEVEFKNKGVTTVVYPEKVSSMGNGYTFGLMSLLLAGALTAHDVSSNVFGDDIIVSLNDADLCIKILDFLGYVVNDAKTFINHPFRESCGYFHYIGRGYIRSFDITYIEDHLDLIVTTNKLYLLWQDCKDWDNELSEIFKIGWKSLRDFTPVYQRGIPPSSSYFEAENLGLYVYDPDYLFRKKGSARSTEAFKLVYNLMQANGLSMKGLDVIHCPIFVPKRSETRPIKSYQRFLKVTSMNTPLLIRGSGHYRNEVCLVTDHGLVYRLVAFFASTDVTITDLNKVISQKRRYMKLPV